MSSVLKKMSTVSPKIVGRMFDTLNVDTNYWKITQTTSVHQAHYCMDGHHIYGYMVVKIVE